MSSLDFEATVKQEEAYLRKVHPTAEDIPSCMKFFDLFLQCNVVAAQMKSLYRYGQMSECGQKLEDFKFCMSNKSMHPQEKYDAWIRRRAEWWARRRMTTSSEDIWEARTEPLRGYPPERRNLDSSPTVE
ncbi:uncharacterized protein PHACADRAFT_145584 [Phanerochaete carnosa HHB-10118-sp]|uniref:Uncharacterized protein n=1 Tax=Phanerochaete carnosa (strain HHB-10118-sp) TaxID=650164 RepID=K5W4C3_PHACS|nr:uncharacterized protein PHACADRAFT_145584 [Phanerochaete carnosa HHB-10118-sp]EKM54010.1 hypothetical protein PHACADRAFT_145584 [Phanerochaete carnosa HHB-10118-sp]